VESEGVYRLYDEGSASGTYLNYEQLELAPQELADDDVIHIGRVQLRFHVTAIEADSTQIMPSPQQAVEERESASDDDSDLSTQPYLPHQPKSPEHDLPPEEEHEDDDADDVSTQPFLPHQPKR
jgi:predicted component of type VI protein secretion system